MANVPADLKYSKSHEWVRLEGDVAVIGITDFAQSELGDVVYVDLPEAGRVLQLDESFGTIESVKTVSELYAPVAGKIIEVNPALASRSELVNEDPYQEGYLIKVQIEGSLPDSLLDANAYSQFAQ